MYRHAIKTDERHYNAWYGLGAIYYRQEKFELAEYHFRRALSINAQSSVLHCYLGMVLHANKKCEEALDLLHEASAMEPKNPQARFQRANVLITMEQYEAALVELEAVRDYAPKESSVHFLMGKVCKKLERLDEAMMHFTFALDLNPKDNNMTKNAIDRLEQPDMCARPRQTCPCYGWRARLWTLCVMLRWARADPKTRLGEDARRCSLI